MTKLPPKPPLPGDDQAREHSALRRRMLEGSWDDDAITEVNNFFPPETRETMGLSALDTSKCLLDKTATDLAVAYRRPPVIAHDLLPDVAGDEAEPLSQFKDVLDDAGLWQLQPETQRYLWAVREAIVRPEWVEETGKLLFRSVFMDHVHLEAPPYDPDQPHLVVEARPRTVTDQHGREELRWTWDVLSVRRDEDPYYRVLLPKPGARSLEDIDADLTEQVLGQEFVGSSYPFVVDGDPVVPHVLYHASRNGRLRDPYRNKSLVRATLRAAAYYTFLGYAIRDASFPQRVTIDCELEVDGAVTNGVRRIPVSPTTILPLRSANGTGGGSIDQWQKGIDPERLEMTIGSYVAGALSDIGLQAETQERTGGPESGWAISLKRSIVRERQMETEPNLRRGDGALMARAAALLNRHSPDFSGLPESDWLTTYSGLPLSPAEVEATIEQAKGDIELGIASRVDLVLARNPGWSRDKAIQHLTDVTTESARFPTP